MAMTGQDANLYRVLDTMFMAVIRREVREKLTSVLRSFTDEMKRSGLSPEDTKLANEYILKEMKMSAEALIQEMEERQKK